MIEQFKKQQKSKILARCVWGMCASLLATGVVYSQKADHQVEKAKTIQVAPAKKSTQKVDMSVLDPDTYRKPAEKAVEKSSVNTSLKTQKSTEGKSVQKEASGKSEALSDDVTPQPTATLHIPKKEAAKIVEKQLETVKKSGGIVRPGSESHQGSGLKGAVQVRKDARTMTLSVPAPRGQITDRNGKPFAQTKVVWYPALKFGQFEKDDRQYVVSWARKRIAQANSVFGIEWKISDDRLWQHYKNRRWLPLPYTRVVDLDEKTKIEKSLMPGLILHPVYLRVYPKKDSAAHVIGYVGSAGKLERGPINYGDPIFERSEGRSGLEKLFDDVLKGTPGLLRKDYEADGTLVVRKMERRPRPGGTVVTTLDRDWQVYAEDVLKRRCTRGAFVVIDVQTGEVLTLASRPSFDLNGFLPFLSSKKYKELKEDPGTPLFGRAFQGAYPPASTFKPIVALAALASRVITPSTLIYCPAAIAIGNHVFKNWSKIPEGDINVKMALARSCNPFFYQVGIQAGPNAFLSMARRLGYGSKTGLPLIGETTGLVPTDKWFREHEKRRIMDGDTANLSIGQGVLLASPLQVAQGMAGIARGEALPQLALIKQIQDVNGRVLMAHQPKNRTLLNVDPASVEAVHEGMREVVNEPYGTGKRGALSYTELCGKTGTAQWGPPSQNKRLAWFAGFFPAKNPRFAFAALYEGKPGEKLSGGRLAAPMISDFFEHFKKDIKMMIKPPPKAMVIEEDEPDGKTLKVKGAPKAIQIEEDDRSLDPIMNQSEHIAPPNQGASIQDSRVPQRRTSSPARAVPVREDGYQAPPLRPAPSYHKTNRAIPVEE